MADVKLFEQTENTNPALTMRVAFGKVATTTENMTLQNFVTWLLGKLAFLKVASNLSDLANPATARTNLSVYSKAEVDALLLLKQAVITFTDWLDGTKVSAKVETASFICKAKRWGNVVVVTGQIKLTSAPAGGEVLFTLPASVGVPSTAIYSGAWDADGATSESIELYIDSGTSNVLCNDSSQDRVSNYIFVYFV